MDNLNPIKVSDCKCCVCGKQAEVFWPVIDPDRPVHPYCRECVEREKDKQLYELLRLKYKPNH